MSNFTQRLGAPSAARPEIAAALLPLTRAFNVLRDAALATPLALFINALRGGG